MQLLLKKTWYSISFQFLLCRWCIPRLHLWQFPLTQPFACLQPLINVKLKLERVEVNDWRYIICISNMLNMCCYSHVLKMFSQLEENNKRTERNEPIRRQVPELRGWEHNDISLDWHNIGCSLAFSRCNLPIHHVTIRCGQNRAIVIWILIVSVFTLFLRLKGLLILLDACLFVGAFKYTVLDKLPKYFPRQSTL